jgi:hypothetical protein
MRAPDFARRFTAKIACCVLSILLCSGGVADSGVRHYVFFNRERERISEAAFLQTKAFEGAQLKYTWRELERQKDAYDFGDIEHDLAFLRANGKKLFIQIQDVSFDPNIRPVPRYLLEDPQYHGGADKQYNIKDDDEAHAVPAGWVARRWDKEVADRFHRLLLALGQKFDGRVEGINLAETAVDFGTTGRLFPKGFAPDIYLDAIATNLVVLKHAFPKSVTIQYANFMPGGEPYLERVCEIANELKVGLGGPDLMPHKPGQMRNSYPLIRRYAGSVPIGIAVQDGNYDQENPKTGRQVTIAELVDFATAYLRVDYLFWCTQEPYYSERLIPFLRGMGAAQN